MRSILEDIGSDLVNGIKGELQRQGHNNTGRLSDSIRFEIEEFGGNMSLLVISDITPNSSKRANSKNAKRALAFAIAKEMMKDGSPTRGAFKFSSNKKRRGFVNRPFGSRKKVIERKIVDGMSVEIDISMDQIVKKV